MSETITPPASNIQKLINALSHIWGYSSAGRALEWHSRGQRFDPAYLHHIKGKSVFLASEKKRGFFVLCGDGHNVQTKTKLVKVDIEINVQLVIPVDFHAKIRQSINIFLASMLAYSTFQTRKYIYFDSWSRQIILLFKLLRRMRLLQHTHISSSPWRPDLKPCNKLSHVQNEIILGPVPHMLRQCLIYVSSPFN